MNGSREMFNGWFRPTGNCIMSWSGLGADTRIEFYREVAKSAKAR